MNDSNRILFDQQITINFILIEKMIYLLLSSFNEGYSSCELTDDGFNLKIRKKHFN